MDAHREYQKWLEYPHLPEPLRQELISIQGNDEEIEDRFGQHLHFGTAGLRGVMGAGLNRLNIYTIRKTSWALAQYVLKQGGDAASNGIAIGYDCRHMSKEFAKEAGLTMAAAGVQAHVSPYLCPTPEVSFSVRHLHAAAGVMVTASHNPPEYNGYKPYGPDGCQLLPDETAKIRELSQEIDDVFQLPMLTEQEAQQRGLFHWTEPQVRTQFVQAAVEAVKFPSIPDQHRRRLSIVYTPLHGAGNVPVREALKEAGYDDVHVVPEQEEPNGDFPTVKSPNPEEHEALKLGIRTATELQADVVMGTDPDSDRVGIAVRDAHGTYQLLTGNQVGALLMDFILGRKKAEGRLPANGIVFKTIVTSELGHAVAASYNIALENTLTGFKYIGHNITKYERTGEHAFLLGYEESYGYLISPIVRDKDAVQTCLAIAEMTAFYKSQGKTLLDALQNLFERFGYYKEELFSTTLQGADAHEKIEAIVENLRENTPQVQGLKLTAIEDYLKSERRQVDENGNLSSSVEHLKLPKSDVLKYLYADGSWLAVRPSGTEPKLKAYLAARGKSPQDCDAKVESMRQAVIQRVNDKEPKDKEPNNREPIRTAPRPTVGSART